MDRDPGENFLDPEERVTPSTGNNDYGESGEARRRKAESKGDGENCGTLAPQPDKVPLNPD